METLIPVIGIIFLIVMLLAAFQPRAQPPQIIYVSAETPGTQGFGCLPFILFGMLAILILGLLR